VTLQRASLKGGVATINGAGLIGGNDDLKIRLDWTTRGPVALGPLEITGASQGSGDLTGAIDRPRLDLSAIVNVVDLPDLPRLRLRDARVTLAFVATATRSAANWG